MVQGEVMVVGNAEGCVHGDECCGKGWKPCSVIYLSIYLYSSNNKQFAI